MAYKQAVAHQQLTGRIMRRSLISTTPALTPVPGGESMSTTATHPPAKAAIQANAAADLRSAYLVAFQKAPVDLVTIVDNCRFNTRYAREILGTLTQAGLLTQDEDTDIWYYNEERFTQQGLAENEESAAELVDNWLREAGVLKPQPKAPPTPPTATSPSRSKPKRTIPGSDCACGCGTATKALFAPGHDARMAGRVARDIANGSGSGLSQEERTSNLLASLPTQALRDKAWAHAQRLLAKGGDPVTTPDPKPGGLVINAPENTTTNADSTFTYGVVKIGKNRFAARRNSDGVIMRHNKALPNVVIPLVTYTELDYTATVEGNPFKSFKALEVQP